MTNDTDIIKTLEKRLHTFKLGVTVENIGHVEKNNDGVITASGLTDALMGEEVIFETGQRGVVFNLDEDTVSIILLSRGDNIIKGQKIKRTGNLLSIIASE